MANRVAMQATVRLMLPRHHPLPIHSNNNLLSMYTRPSHWVLPTYPIHFCKKNGKRYGKRYCEDYDVLCDFSRKWKHYNLCSCWLKSYHYRFAQRKDVCIWISYWVENCFSCSTRLPSFNNNFEESTKQKQDIRLYILSAVLIQSTKCLLSIFVKTTWVLNFFSV